MALWAGQGHSLAKECPAPEVMKEIIEELNEAMNRF